MGSSALLSLVQLADAIKANTLVLDNHLNHHGQPDPSLDVDGAGISIASNEKEVLAARDTLLGALNQLRDLVLGPVGIIMNIGVSHTLIVSM